MIVSISKEFLKLSDAEMEKDACEFISILEHGHYLDMDVQVENKVSEIVEGKLLSHQKAIYEEAVEYLHPTKLMKRFLTTLNFYDFNPMQREILFLKASELLVENAPNEWPVYERMSSAYRNDASYSSVFAYVLRTMHHSAAMLIGAQAGGKGEILKMIEYKNKYEFDNLYKYKSCILFDRDTKDETCFAQDNSPIFKYLCNKDYTKIENSDIYKLDFGDGYIWHSWYKRAIENYFPKSEYQKLGVVMDDYPDDDSYDYIKFPIEKTEEWKKRHKRNAAKDRKSYEKNMMEKVGKSMTRSDYEKNLKSFNVDGVELSEFQLFLLKLAKIA